MPERTPAEALHKVSDKAAQSPRTLMIDIVLATSNPHKVDEMNALFAELMPAAVRFVTLREAAAGRTLVEPAETGTTFEANATIKALSYAEQTGMLCLADDSGIEIDALGGRPGVISSHYCTSGVEIGMPRKERDAANNAKVLDDLRGVPDAQRAARFVCVMTLAACTPACPQAHLDSDSRAAAAKILFCVRGTFEGRIAHRAVGAGGFGYDPLFLVAPAFDRAAAELSPAEKNRRSHRGAAARLFVAELGGWLSAHR